MQENLYEDLGRKIKYLREKRKITQKELAKRTGLSEITIRKYELGLLNNPKMDTIVKIANSLGTDVSFFMKYDIKDFFSTFESSKYKQASAKQYEYKIKDNHLEFIFMVLDEMGYTLEFDENEDVINTIFIKEKRELSSEEIEKMDYFLVCTTKEELLQIQNDSKNYLKFKLNEMLKESVEDEVKE